ncbi:MAG: DUF2726 domain-containing protein [Erysipelotrichia bacterium]|jgi:hypothetical protein|nr:DUF2726 domain-containing protein [Erysipelotrichia bacterium]
MSHWILDVSRAIREGRWLSIVYNNKSSEQTKFWIAFKDIDPQSKKCIVDVFNSSKTPSFSKDYVIYFNLIQNAMIIEGSYAPISEKLLNKINQSPEDFGFLEYSERLHKVLAYYETCYKIDAQPYEQEFSVIPSIDLDTFKDNRIHCNQVTFDSIVGTLHRQLNIRQRGGVMYERIVMNALSIHSKTKGIIPIAYYTVNIDIESKTLIKDEELEFNNQFINQKDENPLNLNDYLDVEFSFFKEKFLEHKQEFIEQLKSHLSHDEKLDELPYFLKIVSKHVISLSNEYDSIQHKYDEGKLTPGIQSFFGMTTSTDKRRQTRKIVLGSTRVNTNQLRIIHHAVNYNVTFVQGPPGSGKSVSIENILHSSIHNGDCVCVTSNNNEAVDNIINNLKKIKFNGVSIKYPFIRLGNDNYIEVALKEMHQRAHYFKMRKDISEHKNQLKELRAKINQTMSGVSQIVADYERKLELKDSIKTIENLIETTESMNIAEENKAAAKIDYEAQIVYLHNQIPQVEETLDFIDLGFDQNLVNEYLACLGDSYGFKLFEPKHKALLEIILKDNEKERLKDFKTFIKLEEGFKSLVSCFPIIFSTNVSMLKLGTPESYFDLVVIEEASQSNSALSLIPLNRSKRVCVIGDPKQLQPVVSLSEEKNEQLRLHYKVPSHYNYKLKSVFNTLMDVDIISKFIFLNKHYRCHKKIARFSNVKYYDNQLDIQTDYNNPTPLKLIDIKNAVASGKNSSHSDIEVIIQEIRSTPANKEIGIVTPFRNQAIRIEERLEKENITNVKVGTIHTFQGQEKDKIILSSAITSSTTAGAFDFIKNNRELINVATTRPKEELVVIADVDQIKRLSGSEMNDYSELIYYVQSNGETQIREQALDTFESRAYNTKKYNSESEAEFIQTLAQIKSSVQKFTFADKSRISDVLNLDILKKEDRSLFNYGIKAHFDFVVFDHNKHPLLIIEICGDEHFTDPVVMANDKKKLEICKKYNIHLIFIKNEDVRRYNEIKKVMISKLSH